MTVELTRRRQIEEVASTLFRERGYAATSVRDIAGALEMRGASLYAHVASKEDVLWSIVDRTASRFESAAQKALRVTGSAGCAERLHALVRAHVGVVTDDVGQASVFVHEWRSLSPERRDAIGARRDRYEGRVRSLIAEGVTCRAFRAADPAIAATYILSACNDVATWYRPGGRLSAERIAAQYADMAVATLAPKTETKDR